ncbi:hypothetical protein N7517_000315 [Penicillium concentricum]|uniref:Fungal N-terminal domain-containing protein n=1 Tax=Penicillium concentricum TaxID=293559 RepID=A0A9W9VIU9_9EURO|nr:uncharacterized protein N7517_000315 [Penicillium concentricum]KAJ5382404.1 hypothetical protein N7517_000315 [Penicillium concentricum]
MSDPLSVAGTAVGIISLGLQVCGEIVSFCQAWRGFDEDIQNIGQKANGLCMPLRSLRQLIKDFRTTDPTIANDLEEKAKSIEEAIKRLKTAVDRYARTTSEQGSLRFQLKKAAYPFRKEWLRDMADDLDSVQGVLATALLIYSAQNTRAVLGKMTQEMQAMHLTLRDIPKQFMPPPSLLQSWCAQGEQLSGLSSSLQIATRGDHMIKSASVEMNRDGTSPSSYKTEATRDTSIAYQDRNPANSGCKPRSRPSRKETEVIKASYYYCSHLLGFAIEATFSLKRGAGGYSIAPFLHLQTLLDKRKSLGYRLCKEFRFKVLFGCAAPDEFELLVNHTLQYLQWAFDLQKATPFELIEHCGQELSLFDLFYNYRGRSIDSGRSDHFHRLLNFLLDCGSKPNAKHHHITAWYRDEFTIFREECSLGSRLLDLGYSFTIHAPESLADRQGIQHLLSQNNDCPQYLQESEGELRDALNLGTASPNDMIDDTWFLIDYAFGWPKGIQILLEAGAAPGYITSGLRYVEDDNMENTYHSVKLLIEAGWPFSWDDIYECQNFKGSGKIKSLLVNELATRRKRLWHLAQSCLPAGQLPKLISDDEKTGKATILDIHTADIHARLVNEEIYIDPILHPAYFDDEIAYGSVYHYHFSADTLEELYQVGFRGVNQLNSQGVMPLMTSARDIHGSRVGRSAGRNDMERMAWLVSKGADPYQEVPGTSATTAHHLGLKIVDYFFESFDRSEGVGLDPLEQYRAWEQTVVELGKRIFLLPSVWDGCVCACSPGGCTAMSVLLRHIFDFFYGYKNGDISFWFQEFIQFLLWWTRRNAETGWEIVRFLTFDALGLEHSCCIENYEFPILRYTPCGFKLKSREEEEAEEIRDEENLRIMDFEKLLDELKIKFDDLGQPVMEFLEEYWYPRMIEYLSHRDPYDEEHVIESRRIGVELEPEEWVVPNRVSMLIGSKIMYKIST